MDLFEAAQEEFLEGQAPLAYRMRPRTLEEFVGQEHLVAAGHLLHHALTKDALFSAVFYGPPGTGKTSLAGILARATKARFVQLDASQAGVSDLRKVIQEARDHLKFYGRRTVLFVDEIHRFNKAQQDVLLPAVERGTLVLIGATTENPFFEVNAPLLSRLRVLPFYPLEPRHLKIICERALKDPERGLGRLEITLEPEALEYLVVAAEGDARVLLNSLEVAAELGKGPDGKVRITEEVAAAAVQKRIVLHDKSGDQHYDVVSAFIKSLRGSDPDAALHWLARMLKAGEDPRFIARRILISAAEDVGLADPTALVVASAAAQALEYVGLPEGELLLAEATLYVACAPKSNRAYLALKRAAEDLERGPVGKVPDHLRDGSHPGARKLGRGVGYLYPHDYPEGFVQQQYLPDVLRGRKYYQPSDHGYEKILRRRLRRLGLLQEQEQGKGEGEGGEDTRLP